jgi:hypothetical protein
MEATASIAVIEVDLRRLVAAVFRLADGTDWQRIRLDAELTAKLKVRFEEESKRRTPVRVTEDLLAYMHLFELRTLIEKNWQVFSSALGEKREFTVLMDKVEDFRNAPAHSRELLPHEKTLLEGISGEIRTKVTLHLSQQSIDSMHYPIIESIRDSFGNVPSHLDGGIFDQVDTDVHLQVGQLVSFEGRAWDPQGRELIWHWGVTIADAESSAIGNDVTIGWTPLEKDVRRSCHFVIEMKSTGPYHRSRSYDHRVTFGYTVDPPAL